MLQSVDLAPCSGPIYGGKELAEGREVSCVRIISGDGWMLEECKACTSVMLVPGDCREKSFADLRDNKSFIRSEGPLRLAIPSSRGKIVLLGVVAPPR
jgi:hypothetical protein